MKDEGCWLTVTIYLKWQFGDRRVFNREATLELALLVHWSVIQIQSVKIKHQNQVSKLSIKIKRQNQVSKSSVKIKPQNQTSKSKSSVKIKHHQES